MNRYFKSPLIVFAVLFQLNSFGQNIDSLMLVLRNAKQDTVKIQLRFDIGVATGNFNVGYWDTLLADAKKTSYKKYQAGILNNLGYIYDDLGEILAAIECYKKGLKIQEELGHKQGISTTLNNLGQVYKKQGDISRALEYFHRSLKLQEEVGDKGARAVSLNNIGRIYSMQGDISKAMDCFEKSLKLNEETDDKKGIAQSLNSIGLIYRKKGDTKKSLEYYNKSLLIRKITGDKRGLADVLNSIGSIYGSQNRMQKALDNFNMSLEMYEELKDKRGIAQSLNAIATLLVKKNEVGKAFSYASRSLQLAQELGFPETIKNTANTLKIIYQMQNKYKDAFEMFELEIQMRDSVINEENQKIIVKKQMQYTYEKKEMEGKAEQDKKDLIASEQLKQKEKERNYFIAGFVLVALLALFIFRGLRQKHKANAIITHQKVMVEEKQKEILDSIHYAKRIQTALMTSDNYFDKSLNRLQKRE